MDAAGARTPSLEVDVLGPLRVRVDGHPVDVPGPGRRAVLALLAMAGGRAVGVAAIIDALWPDGPPETGSQAVQSHVSRLRRTLGPASGRLTRVGPGYALDLRPEELDAATVRRAAAVVRSRLRTDPASAAREATDALARWRGDPLGEFPDVAPLAAEAVGLRELRSTLRDDALEARLIVGEEGLAAEAAAAVAADPLRERTVSLQLRVLAAEGRAAEAMEAAAAFRRRLVEETGIDPSQGFARLEQDVAAGALAPASDRGRVRPQLTRPRGPMVGRDQDREELLRLLESHPAVTVTGPGGVGKTRLALDVAADLAHRGTDAVVVPLAEVTEPARVPEAVASAAALRIGTSPTAASVTSALADRNLLLVIDNCEHVVAAVRELVSELATRAPAVRVLATSRTTVHVPAEYVVRLQPLPLPADARTTRQGAGRLDEIARQPAVRAFLEHARRRQGGPFDLTPDNVDALVTVLRRLDGLPLAIELAAAQVAVLPVDALHRRLGRALDVLAAEQPAGQARHRTLRTTIAWSYQLLGTEEQALLRSLAPFPGGVDLETVEVLAPRSASGTDPLVLLARLVDASLVTVDPQGAARYTLLDTVRAYLLEELDARGERAAAEDRFLAWAVDTAQDLGRGLDSPDEPAADRRLRVELANLRAARDLARHRGDLDVRVAVTLAFAEAAIYRDVTELWTWSHELAADPTLPGHPLEVVVLGSAAESSWLLGDQDGAEALARRGLAVAQRAGVAESLTRRCWSALGVVAMFRAEFETSRSRWLKAADLSEDPASQLATAAMASAYAGDRETAARLVVRAREATLPGHGVGVRAYVHYAAGEVATDPEQAVREYTKARQLASTCGASFIDGLATVGLATVLARTGDVAAAADGFLLLLDYWPATGNRTQLWTTVRNAALLLLDQGRLETAALLLAGADAARSASAVGGDSGARLAEARHALATALAPEARAEVEARSRTLGVADLLGLARDELRRLAGPKPGAVSGAAPSTPGSGTAR